MKQAKSLEKQLATEDTLIESLLSLLIQMSESGSHQVGSGNEHNKRENLENANASELLLLLSHINDMRSSGSYLNRNKLSNAVAMLLKMEFDKNSTFKNLILERELVEEQKEEQPAAEAVEEEKVEESTMMIDTTNAGVERARKEKADKEQKKQKAEDSKKRADSIKLQLLLIGAIRLIAADDQRNNKTFIVHLLKGMLFKDDYFKRKGSTMMKKQTDLLESEKEIQPPLVEIMSVTDRIKEYMHDLDASILLETNEEVKESLKKEHIQTTALHRNLNLLIVDIFKEFDQVVEKVLQTSKKQKDFSVSQDAVISLTSLLNLAEVDKKLLSSLGKALVQIAKNSVNNWNLVHEQFQKTSIKALQQVNAQLIEVEAKFKSNRLQITPAKEVESPVEESKAEPDLNQLRLRPVQDSQISDSGIPLANRESVTSETGGKKLKLNPHDEEWLKQLINRNSDQHASLRNILNVYN